MKTYTEQIQDHLKFLESQGLAVETLEIGAIVRCREIGQLDGRGELAYSTNINEMSNGCIGLVTWCRNSSGAQVTYRTYGMGPTDEEIIPVAVSTIDPIAIQKEHESAAKKSYGFWNYSATSGSSDYLIRKGVGSYGIRFRVSKEFGNVAVVPMRDIHGKIWSYQLLNPDGTKIVPKGSRVKGVFHALKCISDGDLIGLSEGYSTSATCYELTGIPMVCAFFCENLVEVASNLAKKYPKSQIIVFADNDRHLEEQGMLNIGVLSALEAVKQVDLCVGIATPEIVDCGPSKEVSDWNDLVHTKGVAFARDQITQKLKEVFPNLQLVE